ncbi:MAG TPA: hypothetical protein VHS80_16015, partial [Chthoniobacterales bacterium]|nr:hypothetical protein [Chthoniobacterales bacterium]
VFLPRIAPAQRVGDAEGAKDPVQRKTINAAILDDGDTMPGRVFSSAPSAPATRFAGVFQRRRWLHRSYGSV